MVNKFYLYNGDVPYQKAYPDQNQREASSQHHINVYSLILNCVTMDSIRITVNTVGPAISTYGPGALRRIILARLESKSYKM